MNYYEFEKNKSSMIRIAPHVYEGYDVVDIRIYAKDRSGKWVPTPKGISVNIDRIPDLLRGLEWGLQQPCTDSDCEPAELMAKQAEDQLANLAHSLLRKHGVEVHWDTAEDIVLKPPAKDQFTKWQLHYILATRKDLFEYRGDGCFKAL